MFEGLQRTYEQALNTVGLTDRSSREKAFFAVCFAASIYAIRNFAAGLLLVEGAGAQ